MNLEELKKKSPAELIAQAEKLEIENPSTLRKQEILFAILKKLAQKNEQISGGGVLEVLQDGFGFFWLQLKLCLVIILTIYHFFLFQCLRKFAENSNSFSSKFYRIINEIPTIFVDCYNSNRSI